MTVTAEVWVVGLDDVELQARIAALLSPAEHAEFARMAFAHDRRRRAAARAALRIAAGHRLGIDPAAVALERDERGRPVVPGTALHVSLSHTGGLGAVACAPVAVGVDVERLDPARDVQAIARRWFAPEEAEALAAAADPVVAFTELWAAKEALLKALGTGISGGLDRPRFAGPPGALRLVALEGDGAPAADWTVVPLAAGEGHRGAVAVRAPDARIVVSGRLPGAA